MGCPAFKLSVSSYDSVIKNPNPNPLNYLIMDYLEYNNNLLIYIKYPDCTNYEGNKILLYKDVCLDQLKKQGSIDPHFSENKISPFARFEPTNKGWRIAKALLSQI